MGTPNVGTPVVAEPKVRNPVEAILDVEDALFTLPEEAPAIPPPTSPAAPTPPVTAAEPPATDPAVSTTPAAEPTPAAPATAAAPEAPPAVETPTEDKDGSPWKAKREAERRAKEAQDELNAARAREQELLAQQDALRRQLEAQAKPPTDPAADPTAPGPDDDPLLVGLHEMRQRLQSIEDRNQAVEAQNREMQAALQRQERDRRLADEAAQFSQKQTDFAAARDFYIAKEIEAATLTGELDAVARDIRAKAGAQVRQVAEQHGTTEAEAARTLAQAVLFEQRLQLMHAAAQASGETTAERVYKLARLRGYAPTDNGTPAPVASTPAAPNPALSAADQTREQMAATAAASIASAPRVSTPPPGQLNQAQFRAMNPIEQGNMINFLDAQAALGQVPEDWLEQMTAGQTIAVPPGS